MTKVSEAIKFWGGRTAAAVALGCTRQALHKWEKTRKGMLPELYQLRAVAARKRARK